MDIVITMLDGTLKVYPQDTVGSLKMRIQEQLGVPAARQRLILSTPLNDDSKTLSSYNLQSGYRVSLQVTQLSTIQVFVKNVKGTNSTYDITPDETVENFKRRVQEREGFLWTSKD